MRLVHAVLLLSLVTVAAGLCSAQDDQTIWGAWRPLGPVAPYVEWQVKCLFSAQDSKGNWYSDWHYRFRSKYKHPVDFVYEMQFGDKVTRTNHWMGDFMQTLAPGKNRTDDDDSDGGSQLLGKCSQHTVANNTGLHVKPICVVQSGQDAPCFNDAHGNKIGFLQPSVLRQLGSSENADKWCWHGNVYEPCSANDKQTSQNPNPPSKPAPNLVPAWWVCADRLPRLSSCTFHRECGVDDKVYTNPFQKDLEGEILQKDIGSEYPAADEGMGKDYTDQFATWVHSNYRTETDTAFNRCGAL